MSGSTREMAAWFSERGFSRRETGCVMGVHFTTVQAWSRGRVKRESGPVVALWEALRMLEAAWGRERMVEFVKGSAPEKWLVALAVLGAS